MLLIRRVDPRLPRRFYETEALRGGWTLRQMERQIESQFYERTALSRNKAAMLIKDPFVLEFLGLKDEYSESELEEALTRYLQPSIGPRSQTRESGFSGLASPEGEASAANPFSYGTAERLERA